MALSLREEDADSYNNKDEACKEQDKAKRLAEDDSSPSLPLLSAKLLLGPLPEGEGGALHLLPRDGLSCL